MYLRPWPSSLNRIWTRPMYGHICTHWQVNVKLWYSLEYFKTSFFSLCVQPWCRWVNIHRLHWKKDYFSTYTDVSTHSRRLLPISNTVNSVTGNEKSETQATLKISLSFQLAMSFSPTKSCIAFASAGLLFFRSEVTHLLRAPGVFTALPEPAAVLNISVVAFLFYSKRHRMFMAEIQLHNAPMLQH